MGPKDGRPSPSQPTCHPAMSLISNTAFLSRPGNSYPPPARISSCRQQALHQTPRGLLLQSVFMLRPGEDQIRIRRLSETPVGSQNRIRRGVQRYVTLNCCLVPGLRGFGQAVPSVSFRKRDRGTARRTLFEATFWVVGSAVLSTRRILDSIRWSPTVRAETVRANYAASRQE